jgi:prevent-host-death family protein
MDEIETVTAADLRRDMSTVISLVEHGKRRFVVERHGRPAMALVSVEDLERILKLEDARQGRRYAEFLERAAGLRLRTEAAQPKPSSTDVLRSVRDEA